jgi:GTP-binding protein
MDEVLRVYEKWNTRVTTSLLNKWLMAMKRVHKMPGVDGKFLNIRYIMQIKSRPPTFFIFVNDTKLLLEVYKRFIRNSIIKEFGFEGVPVRLLFRDNMYIYTHRDQVDIPLSQRTIMRRIELNRSKSLILIFRTKDEEYHIQTTSCW